MNYLRTILFSVLLFIVAVQPANSDIIRVPEDEDSIQDGIDAASNGDTVLVADGNYPGDIRLNRNIVLMSEHGGLECIIDGDGEDDTEGITFSQPATLIGFTITGMTAGGIHINGVNGFTISYCQVSENEYDMDNQQGCGIIIVNSTGRIEHSIVRANSSIFESGAGIYMSGSTVDIFDSVIRGNIAERFGGGINATAQSEITLANCVIANNISGIDGGGVVMSGTTDGDVSNCTFMDNRAGGGGGGLYKGSNSNPTLINCVFFGNENDGDPGPHIWQQNSGGGAGGEVIITYSCVDGGPQNGDGWDWDDETMLEDDPLVFGGRVPLWGQDGFYLDEESPCIDAGSDDAENLGYDTLTTVTDLYLDVEVVDMGYHYDPDNFLLLGELNGYVYDLVDHRRMEGVVITTSRDQSTVTNWNGFWIIDEALVGNLNITASTRGYNDTTAVNQELFEDSTLSFEFVLLHPEISIDVDTLSAWLEPGDSIDLDFSISNQGNGPLHWTIKPQLPGEANTDPWEHRFSYDAGDITEDPRIEGMVLIDDTMFVSGGGNDSNFVYKITLDGELQGSFPQFTHGRDFMTDLAWDGELLWGVADDTVWGFTTEGVLETSFESPLRRSQALTWDTDSELLWMASVTSDILGYTREGDHFETLERQQGLFTYGLAYYPEDVDGYNLYILHTQSANSDTQVVRKMNKETQDIMFVATLDAGDGSPRGASISNQLDAYSWVFFAISNDGDHDRVDVWQLAANTAWMRVSPLTEGTINPDAAQDLTLTFNASGISPGNLRASLLIEHNDWGQLNWIWLLLTIGIDAVGGADSKLPADFQINSVYPNPFNSTTTISYSMPFRSDVAFRTYDLSGRLVQEIFEPDKQAGNHKLSLSGEDLPSGVYISRIEALDQVRTVKLVLMK